MGRVYIERFTGSSDLNGAVGRALEWLNARSAISPGTRVFIKPNLTWRVHKPGVTVTPVFLRALVENLLPLAPNITIGESEGGQACFQAEEAFENHGLYELSREHGIRVVNLSRLAHEQVRTTVGRSEVNLLLPSFLLHEVDVFLTVPVPKIHAMTGVSLGFKNQWGCLGDKMRVTQHPRFDRAIIAINKLLKPRFCIFDGTYFLDHTGPMIGEPVPMGMVVAGDDVGAASCVCCEVMDIDPLKIAHHRMALLESMFPTSRSEIECNVDPRALRTRAFRLRRSLINYVQLAAFKSIALNRLFYDGPLADGLHEALWFARRNRLVKGVLYGRYGSGDANRGGRSV